jgi:serralysin
MAMFDQASAVSRYALSGNKAIDALLNGSAALRVAWSTKDAGTTQVSYSFPLASGSSSRFTDNYGTGETKAAIVAGMNATQASQIAGAFEAWSNVANIAFTKINETSAGAVGDIRIAFTSKVPNGYWGYSLGASDGASNAHGDIWVDDSIIGQSFASGTYNYYSMLHEIGHSLGLKHPFEGTKIAAGLDNRRYTIMSYTDPANVWGKNAAGATEYLIKTPMVYDIQAMQKIYGANMKYHLGNDTYTFAPNAPSFETIWDAGGNDTISVADFTNGCTISLVAGTYSSLAYNSANIAENIGIAFNCLIENAIGGSGADAIRGTSAANTLEGRAGNDTLTGDGGNDILLGGDGDDTLLGGTGDDNLTGAAGNDVLDGGTGNDVMAGGDGIDTVSYESASATVKVSLAITTTQVTGGAGNDTFSGFENLTGGKGSDILTGSDGANTLDGGAGNDQLLGGGGRDILIGGAGRDILKGGDGADIFRFTKISDLSGTTASSADQIFDFSRSQGDLIDLSGIDAIKKTNTVDEAFTFIGSAAFTKAAGQLRYVASGTYGLLTGDIDGNGIADFAIRVDGVTSLDAIDFIL